MDGSRSHRETLTPVDVCRVYSSDEESVESDSNDPISAEEESSHGAERSSSATDSDTSDGDSIGDEENAPSAASEGDGTKPKAKLVPERPDEMFEHSSATETDGSGEESMDEGEENASFAASEDEGMNDPGEILEESAHSSLLSSNSGEKKWLDMLEKTKDFVAKHGTLVAPYSSEISSWLKEQAALYQRAMRGEAGWYSPKKIAALEKLGIRGYLKNPVHMLNRSQEELVWLGEVSTLKRQTSNSSFDWEFIRQHASPQLAAEMERKETFGKRKNTKLVTLLGPTKKKPFLAFRQDVRTALACGVKLQLDSGMGTKITTGAGTNSSVVPEEKGATLVVAQKEMIDAKTTKEEKEGAKLEKRGVSDCASSASSSVYFEEAMVTNTAGGSSSTSESEEGDASAVVDPPSAGGGGSKWSLNVAEEEVATLGEESMVAKGSARFDWNFIRRHASAELKQLMEAREIFTVNKGHKLFRLFPRIQNKYVKEAFNVKREEMRNKLKEGYRREEMKGVLPPQPTEEPESEDLGTGSLSLWQDSTMELTAAEEELAWLLEEGMIFSGSNTADWDFIQKHASPVLVHLMEAKKTLSEECKDKLPMLLRRKPAVKKAFEKRRWYIKQKLASGYRRYKMKGIIKSSMTASEEPQPHATAFASESSQPGVNALNRFEEELACLGEESMLASNNSKFDWEFIQEHASPELKRYMNEREIFTKYQKKKIRKIVRMHLDRVAKAFNFKRAQMRKSLLEGFRRDETKHSLPVSPGDRWADFTAGANFTAEASSPTKLSRKRNATEDGFDFFDLHKRSKLSAIQEELCWLGVESRYVGGLSKVDWDFIEEHASEQLKQVMKEKQRKQKNSRTFYAYLNLRTEGGLKNAFEERKEEILKLLQSGYRRKGMEKVLPIGRAGAELKETAQRYSTPVEGIAWKRQKVIDSSDICFDHRFLPTSPKAGHRQGDKVYVRSADSSSMDEGWRQGLVMFYADVKMCAGGYRRQFKVQFDDGGIEWRGHDDGILSETEFLHRCQRKGATSVGVEETPVARNFAQGGKILDTEKSCGMYSAVFTLLFASDSDVISCENITNEQVLQHKAATSSSQQNESLPESSLGHSMSTSGNDVKEELKTLMEELRFQRDNYRRELQRQQDMFGAHVSMMEYLERRVMGLISKDKLCDEGIEERGFEKDDQRTDDNMTRRNGFDVSDEGENNSAKGTVSGSENMKPPPGEMTTDITTGEIDDCNQIEDNNDMDISTN